MNDPVFLTREQVLYIQEFEANLTGSPTLVRDAEALQAAMEAPKATFDGQFLMDLFEMAATYAFADLLLDFLNKAFRKQDVAQYFRDHAFTE